MGHTKGPVVTCPSPMYMLVIRDHGGDFLLSCRCCRTIIDENEGDWKSTVGESPETESERLLAGRIPRTMD